MWSEHCSYKSSKVHLRQFGEKQPPTDRLLAGIGENAGVVDVGDGWAVTFKVESHNHPSYVEPYQGAATGVGGIVRDILAMGARPVAVLDPLRFGPADAPDTARVLPGVVAGIGGYGNCLGLPNIGGEVVFDESYQGNPLVNALCVGVLRKDSIQRAHASGAGNKGDPPRREDRPGRIGGVSVLASATFDDTRQSKRPSVQSATRSPRRCSSSAVWSCTRPAWWSHPGPRRRRPVLRAHRAGHAGDGGMHVDLDRVPLREPSMGPEEVLASESRTDVCRGHAGPRRRLPGRLREVGGAGHRPR